LRESLISPITQFADMIYSRINAYFNHAGSMPMMHMPEVRPARPFAGEIPGPVEVKIAIRWEV